MSTPGTTCFVAMWYWSLAGMHLHTHCLRAMLQPILVCALCFVDYRSLHIAVCTFFGWPLAIGPLLPGKSTSSYSLVSQHTHCHHAVIFSGLFHKLLGALHFWRALLSSNLPKPKVHKVHFVFMSKRKLALFRN